MPTNALAMKTVVELRQLAAGIGVRRVNEMKKHQLIIALENRKPCPNPPVFGQERPFSASSSATMVVSFPNAKSPYPVPAPPPEGLPIPDQYGTTRLVIMAQNPHRLFVYWRFNNSQLSEVQLACQDGSFPVLVLMSNGGIEQREIELRSGSSYHSVIPKCSYEAALALRNIKGEIRNLIISNRITMPSDSICPESVATETGLHDQFHELYELTTVKKRISSGNSSDRLEDQDSMRIRPAGILPLGTSSTSLVHNWPGKTENDARSSP